MNGEETIYICDFCVARYFTLISVALTCLKINTVYRPQSARDSRQPHASLRPGCLGQHVVEAAVPIKVENGVKHTRN